MRLLVFSDLDGTLLDHDTYAWEPARGTIAHLRARAWPLVLVTSKTRAEVEGLRRDLEVDEPFIVENGAAAFFPARYAHVPVPRAVPVEAFRALVFGRPYDEVRAFVASVGGEHGLEGFGDMSVERVAELTGLSPEDAALAKRREFTEPFLLEHDGGLGRLETTAAAAGFQVTTGGRFHHLVGAGQDKGKAVRAVHAVFEDALGESVTTVGLGDGRNDVPMLEVVDHAVLIPAPGRPLPGVEHPRLRVAPAEGPRGWSAALEALIEELDAT